MSKALLKPPHLNAAPFQFLDQKRRLDPYYWLHHCEEDDEELIAHLQAENTHFLTEARQQAVTLLFEEMRQRVPGDQESPLRKFKNHYYAMRDREGFDYAFMVRTKDKSVAATVILDLNKIAEGKEYCDFGCHSVSPDEKRIAITIDTQGYGLYRLFIFDIATQALADTGIENLDSDAFWTKESDGIYIVKKTPDTHWASQVLHIQSPNAEAIGAEGEKRVGNDYIANCLYEESDKAFCIGLEKTSSDRYLLITCNSTNTSETYCLSLDKNKPQFFCFAERKAGVEYALDHGGDKFYLLSNHRRKNFEILACPEASYQQEYWEEIYCPKDDWLVDSMDCYQDAIVIEESLAAQTRLTLVSMPDCKARCVDFGPCTLISNSGANDFEAKRVQIEVSAMHRPARTFELDIISDERELVFEEKVLGDFNADDYAFELRYCRRPDTVDLPISVCYRKSETPLAERPLFVLGYGAYGVNYEAEFASEHLSLLDRDVIIAIIHCRGGSEQGQRWYDEGRTVNKMNTFLDFIAGTDYLLDQGFGDSKKVVASGASAGGLLMGYLANAVPEKFAVILAQVPFVDVLTTMLDDSIPLTSGEYEEWGNPQKSADYDRMASYSPYDNVKAQSYPAMLISSALYDGQVSFREPTKWVAKLRTCNQSDKPIALYTDLGAGHGGGSERFAEFKDTAMEYAFLFEQLGIELISR